MRKSRAAAAETRERIVTTAAREFRQQGVVATGLNDLMRAAGLTHGGFYKHFESKDQLVAEACAAALAELMGRLEAAGPAGAIATYLAPQHRDNPGVGCPLAALGSELGRADPATRAVAAAGFLQLVAILAGRFATLPPAEARRQALVAGATLIGALTVARLVPDPELSAEILREAERSLAGDESRGVGGISG